MRIVALGRSEILYKSIIQMHGAGHSFPIIATCKAAPEYETKEKDFEVLAERIHAKFLLTQNINTQEIVKILRDASADIAISVNWINLIGPEVCSAFPYGVLNAHAGDLPRYRGNAPVAWAMLQGEREIGLTIHQMDPYQLDAGPIYLKAFFNLSDNTYINEVFLWIAKTTPNLFLETVNGIDAGKLQPEPQPDDRQLALRCYPRQPEDGSMYWFQTAEFLARLVRVSAEPFAGAYTFLKGKKVIVWRAHPESWECPSLAIPGQVIDRDLSTGNVKIATGNGVLVLEEIESQEHLRGKPTLLIKSLRDRLNTV